MNLKECYQAVGGNYEDVMRRFMSEERVDRFLKMFLGDQSFTNLCDAMNSGDYDEAFRAVHTMKGICMNLGFVKLMESCIILTENLRTGEPDMETKAWLEQTKDNYLRTTEAIRNHLG